MQQPRRTADPKNHSGEGEQFMEKRKLMRMLITVGIVVTLLFAMVALSACNTDLTLDQQADALGQQINALQNGGNPTVENIDTLLAELAELRAEVIRLQGENTALLARIDGYKAQLEALRLKLNPIDLPPTNYCTICYEPHSLQLVNTNGVFEAAFLDFSRRVGAGASGAMRLQMVHAYNACESGLAHQGSTRLAKHFHYMNAEIDTGYNYNPPMDFVFYSDRNVSEVSLVVRLSADMDLLLMPDIYFVSLNGRQIMFDSLEIKFDFVGKQDFTISTTETIREGRNIIRIVVRQNNLGWHGMQAAPGFAHVRLENLQGAELLWRPQICNLHYFVTLQGSNVIFCLHDNWTSRHPDNQGINSWNS